MSFRIEEKILIPNFNPFEFKKWLFSKNAKILFPTRIINSVYFDNDLKMFTDSNDGRVPRKKIRLRTYETKNFFSSKLSYMKETKITYYNNRYKKTEKCSTTQKKFNLGIYDKDYGLCKPNLNVVYKRSYFKIYDTRLTLDEDINYSKITGGKLSSFSTKEKDLVVEIKSQNINNTDYLKELFPLPRSRFSKYCRGIEAFLN